MKQLRLEIDEEFLQEMAIHGLEGHIAKNHGGYWAYDEVVLVFRQASTRDCAENAGILLEPNVPGLAEGVASLKSCGVQVRVEVQLTPPELER